MKYAFFFLAILMLVDAGAQERLRVSYGPKGEFAVRTNTSENFLKGFVTASPKLVFYHEINGGTLLYAAPDGIEIRHVQKKLSPYDTSKVFLLILLSDNTSVQVEIIDPNSAFPYTAVKKLGVIPYAQYETGRAIVGDDLYVMSDEAVYISSDTPNHLVWTIDTMGLGDAGTFQFCHDIDIDTTQKVWLATQSGLFTQLLGSPVWNKVTGYTSPIGFLGPDKVFVDRMQRIWVAEGPYIFVSTDGGNSFQAGPTSVSMMTSDFGDDIYGNIYVVKQKKALYFSQGGTQPFVQIDQNILPDFVHFTPNASIFNDVTGDTVVHLSTVTGIYSSADQGNSWTYGDQQPALRVHAVAATSDHRLLMTTNTGLFRRETNGTWTRLYPQGNAHLGGMRVFTDASGTIYHTGESVFSDASAGDFKMVRKSTDNGNSFTADTAGAFAEKVYMGIFFIDESGVQHAAAIPFVTGQGPRPKVWKKEPGQPWSLDTSGLSYVTGLNSNAAFRCFGSDDAGNIYLAVLNVNNSINYIYRRAQSGGPWVAYGTMGGSVTEINGRAGKLVASNSNGAMYYNSGNWTIIPNPPSAPNAEVWAANVSSNGVVWAYFEDIDAANNITVGRGIWYTTDMMTWKYPQPNKDTALFDRIVPLGDSVFGLTRNFEGVYVFDSSTTNSVQPPASFFDDPAVRAIPNPFSDRTTLQFSLDKPAPVRLCVYDLKGTLVCDEPLRLAGAGSNKVEIKVPDHLPPGVLIYRLQVGDKYYRGKLLKR